MAMLFWSVSLLMDKVIAIIGPTAVGKTALSFALAQYFHTDLVSGDAYQIYRRMNIGTAKPALEELRRYKHYLIDVAEPNEPYSAALFCHMAEQAVQAIHQEGKLPILVGGTGLYVQALLEGFQFDGSKVSEALRQQARHRIASFSDGELQDYIKKNTSWQPPDWHELFANTHRLVRLMAAIEQGEGYDFVRAGKAPRFAYDAFVVGLTLPREILYERIERRVDSMLQSGWIEEVQGLLDSGVSRECQAMQAIGYGEIAAYLDGNSTLQEAACQIKIRTRRFAKRQISWYKRMPYIHWFEKNRYASEDALAAAVIRQLPWQQEGVHSGL